MDEARKVALELAQAAELASRQTPTSPAVLKRAEQYRLFLIGSYPPPEQKSGQKPKTES